jgi:phosphinothricin acetyltransferase
MKESTVSIHDVSEVDYQSIADIYNEYILEGSATMEEKTYDFQRVKVWLQGFNIREKMLVLKTASGKVIGWGVIKNYSDREGYRTTCETSVYLTQNERRKGYGTLLKKRLINECISMGYHHIVAKIFATNIASIQYNLNLGYQIVGRQNEIGFKNGEWVDVVIMQYLIKG